MKIETCNWALKLFLASSCVCLPPAAVVFGQGTFDALAVIQNPDAPVAISAQRGFGWSFVPTMDIQVIELGLANDGQSLEVVLWNGNFEVLSSRLISTFLAQTGATFESISPVLLTAGTTYYLCGQVPPPGIGGVSAQTYFAPDFSWSPQLSAFTSYVVQTNGQWQPFGDGSLFFGPTFRFTPVPEPSPVILFSLASLMFCHRFCMRRSSAWPTN